MPDDRGESRDEAPVDPTVEARYSEWISEVRRLYVEPKGSEPLFVVEEEDPQAAEPVRPKGRGRLLGRGRRQQAADEPPAPAAPAPVRPTLADLIAAPSVTRRPAEVEPAPSDEPSSLAEEPVARAEPEPQPVVEEPAAVVEPEPEPVVEEPSSVVEPEPVVEEPAAVVEPEPEPVVEAEPLVEEPVTRIEPEPVPALHPVDLTDDPSWLVGPAVESTSTHDAAFEAWPVEPAAAEPGPDDEPVFEAWPVVVAGDPSPTEVETDDEPAGRPVEETETAAEPVRRRSWWDEGDVSDDADPADSVPAQAVPQDDLDDSARAADGEALENDVAAPARRSDRHRPTGRTSGRAPRRPAPAAAVGGAGAADHAPSFEAALLAAEADEAEQAGGSGAPLTRAESRAAARRADRARTTRRRRALVAAIVLLVVVAATWWVLRPHQTASADTTTAQDAAAVLVVQQHAPTLHS